MTISRAEEEDLQRIDGLVAVPPGTTGPAGEHRLAKSVEKRFANAGCLADVKPFLRSGWQFVEGSARHARLPIYCSPHGRLYLVGNAMNVKFAETLSEGEILSILQDHHLEKKRELGFAPNLMTVTPSREGDVDTVQISRSLANHPFIEFAEPMLLEELGGRS